MKLIPVKCPCCGGNLEIPDDANKFFCNHCGTQIIASNADLNNIKIEGVVQIRNADFDIQGGVLVGYHGEGVHVVIPDGVKKIGEGCFKDTMIESVKIPDSVTVIAKEAFSGCIHLAEAELPHGLEVIGYRAFLSCALKSIVIPEGVTVIDADAFSSRFLKEVVILGKNVQICDGAFAYCVSLEKIEINENTVLSFFGYGFFGGCKELKEIILPDSLTEIPTGMFQGCESLKKLNIPLKCQTICKSAFKSCVSLEEVVIPEGVKIIDDESFLGCTSLEKIRIPEGVIRIGDKAFANCPNLKSIEIPQSAKAFVSYIFGKNYMGMNGFCKISLEELRLHSDRHLGSWLLELENLKMVYCNGVPVDLPYLDKMCEGHLRSDIFAQYNTVYGPWRKLIIKQKQDMENLHKERMQKKRCPKCDIPLKSVKLFDKSEMVCPKCGAKVNYPKSRN